MEKSKWEIDVEAAFVEWATIHNYAPKTIETYHFMFFSFFSFINGRQILLKNTTQTLITEYLRQKVASDKTKETYLWLLSDIFNHLIEDGDMAVNPAENLLRTKKKNKRGKDAKRIPVALSSVEIKKLLTHIYGLKNDYSGNRQRCAMLIMLGCGLRVSEVCGLRNENLHLDDENPFLTVIGKGNKERAVPIPDGIINYLLDFRAMRATSTGVFLSAKGTGGAYRPVGLYTMVRREMRVADVVKVKMSPHVLRHTYCTTQLANRVSLAVVKAWMGHDFISTTAKYEHVQGARNGEKPVMY